MTTATARNPNQRLALALAASACLHVALLLPAGWLARRAPPEPPPLQATLAEPERAQSLATQPEPEPAPELRPPPTPATVPREPTLPAQRERPRELKGKALDTALAALASEEFYPRAAIARGLEGRVVLLLTLDAAGRVTGIEVASGSGHALLDDAALRAATRIAALPGGRRQVLLPVEFRLE